MINHWYLNNLFLMNILIRNNIGMVGNGIFSNFNRPNHLRIDFWKRTLWLILPNSRFYRKCSCQWNHCNYNFAHLFLLLLSITYGHAKCKSLNFSKVKTNLMSLISGKFIANVWILGNSWNIRCTIYFGCLQQRKFNIGSNYLCISMVLHLFIVC